MPELPEVETVKETLKAKVIGKKINKVYQDLVAKR
jgi:formamidopyrimidine-DNA glycosylase